MPLNAFTKEILAHRKNYFGSHGKTIFEPSEDKIALKPDRGVILVERKNNSEGS